MFLEFLHDNASMDTQGPHDVIVQCVPQFCHDSSTNPEESAVFPIATSKVPEHHDTQIHRPSKIDSASNCSVPMPDSHMDEVDLVPVSPDLHAWFAPASGRLFRDKPLCQEPEGGHPWRMREQFESRLNGRPGTQHRSAVNLWWRIDRILWPDRDDRNQDLYPVIWVKC